MSIVVISGSLTIREINGRNGPFKVGKLNTQLGEFAVKDALLDQYNPGTYEGNFGIGRIYPSYYVAGGRIVVEVRASIENMALSGIDDVLPEEVAFVEPDPADSEVIEADTHPVDSDSVETTEVTNNPEAEVDPDADPDVELFGSLMPLGDSVKLDPTVKRKVLRAQCDRLKEHGYQFNPAKQVWFLADR